jgi:hypothetical protein
MSKYYLFIVIILTSITVCAKLNTVKCDADVLNVRNEPSMNSKIVEVIKAGDTVKVIDESRESVLIDSINAKWYKIETKNKKVGWVFSGYLSSIDGKYVPFGIKNIIGEWLIDDNDGVGALKFNFFKNGILNIKGEKLNTFDGNCKWVYYSDKDNIEIIFGEKQQEWQARIKRLKSGNYDSADQYLVIDEKRSSLLIKLSRNYYNENKKIFENISFPFFGYSVLKRVM